MISNRLEKLASGFIAIGLASTILIVTTFMSIEPVNAPKMLILSVLGLGTWATLFSIGLNRIFKAQKTLSILIMIFVILVVINIPFGDGPAVQTFYGTFGRNTGALTYFSLAGILFLVAQFKSGDSLSKIVNAILVAGIVNLVYCGLDILGPDLLGWQNQYGEILGTLGNPNFISAFLGIFSALILPFAFDSARTFWFRFGILSIEIVTVLEIIKSHARQGFIIYLLGIAVCVFFWIASRDNIRKINYIYLPSVIFIGFMGLLGLMQKGPLAPYIYKGSIAYRGVYWDAGISMGLDNPLTGLGFDAYGDYYREFRSAKAVISPGVTVVTNTSHNVMVDIFAAGGFPLFISYLAITFLGLISIIKISKLMNKFDVLGVSLISGWLAYQVQSIFSINQIGLAICGWVLTGALISYAHVLKNLKNADLNDAKNQQKEQPLKSSTPLILGAVIGFVVALPPVIVDTNWRGALDKGDGARVTEVAQMWPKDSYRTNQIAIALERGGLTDQSLLLARQNVIFTPRNYDAWRILSLVTKSTPEEKENSIQMMHKLDPRNPDLK